MWSLHDTWGQHQLINIYQTKRLFPFYLNNYKSYKNTHNSDASECGSLNFHQQKGVLLLYIAHCIILRILITWAKFWFSLECPRTFKTKLTTDVKVQRADKKALSTYVAIFVIIVLCAHYTPESKNGHHDFKDNRMVWVYKQHGSRDCIKSKKRH